MPQEVSQTAVLSDSCDHIARLISFLFCISAAIIDVNVDCPEANRELLIYATPELVSAEDKTDEYHGYYLVLPFVDPRYVWDDKTQEIDFYSASVYSENQIIVKYPAWPYTFQSVPDRDSWEQILTKKAEMPLLNAMDVARNDFQNSSDVPKEAREFKTLLLRFPQGHVLSSKAVFADAGEDEVLHGRFLKIKVKHSQWKSPVEQWHCVWKVARTDIKARKKGKKESSTTKKSRNQSMMDDIINDTESMHM